jgi:two-component system heavy metal sensor histidine kinase CusS
MKLSSITSRLTIFFSTASTIVLLVVGVIVGTLVESHFEEQDMMELEGKLELVHHALAKIQTPFELTKIPSTLSDALIGHPYLSVTVFGADHQALFSTSNITYPAKLLNPISNHSGHTPLIMWEHDGEMFRGISAFTNTGIPHQPPSTVILAINIKHHQNFMKAFRHNLWTAIAVGILLTIILGWIAARRGLAPIREMTNVAKGISANHLGDRLPTRTIPMELVDLSNAFNEMLTRLETSFLKLSDFSADLAHELRTPISNLMTQTQVAISKDRSADEYREILYSSLEEYERLARMIADMLFLAKAENGLIVPNMEQVDLAAEVRAIFGFYEAFADEKNVKLSMNGHAFVKGDKLMLRRAISNLLSNAIRHTPAGETINVHLNQGDLDGSAKFSIENPGENIPSEHLPRLFDRFYRVDSSRQKSSDGAGLGLAITKSIIDAHHGAISVFSENNLTKFEVALAS